MELQRQARKRDSEKVFFARVRDVKKLEALLLLVLALNGCGTTAGSTRTVDPHLQFTSAQIRARLADLKLINYYPAENAQTNLWTNWQPEVIDRDLARVTALNANAVRNQFDREESGHDDPRDACKLAHAVTPSWTCLKERRPRAQTGNRRRERS